MRTARIGQAVILMMVVAIAASCAATKEYTSKLFPVKTNEAKSTETVALRFLSLDSAETDQSDWVSTDVIMGRDTLNTTALDNFAKIFPASNQKSDSTAKVKPVPGIMVTKPVPAESEPVAKYMNPGEIRTKRTRE